MILNMTARKMIARILLILVYLLTISCASNDKRSATGKRSDPKGSPRKIEFEDRDSINISASEKRPHLKTERRSKPLNLPPDLISKTDKEISAADDEYADKLQVLPELVNARIISQDESNWLEIDSDPETVWKVISDYWDGRGVNLVEYSPKAGIMETEWVRKEKEYDGDGPSIKGFVNGLLNAITSRNTSFDKYRIRLQKVSADKTTLHVSHRQTAKKMIEKNRKRVSDFEWVELSSDQERVADLLQILLVLFDKSSA